MYEEEKDEEDNRYVVRSFEELIEPVADWADGHYIQPSLRNQSCDAGPIGDFHLPLHHHIPLLDMHNDEGKCVYQSQDEHGPRRPAVEYLELLMGDAGQKRYPVDFRGSHPVTLSALVQITRMKCAYITNGSIARDIQPDLVAIGGEPPKENFAVFGQ